MEADQLSTEKPIQEFPINKLLLLTEKIEAVGNAMLVGVIVICAYSYIGKHVCSYYRRFCELRHEILGFSREYRQIAIEAEQIIENKVSPVSSALSSDDSSDEVAGEDDQSADEFDFPSSDGTDDYETDMEEDNHVFSEGFADAQAAFAHSQFRSLLEQERIANAIDCDEYLLEKGLIDSSEFGKSLMIEF